MVQVEVGQSVQVGDLVRSVAGRDCDKYYLVLNIDANYLVVVNGEQRRVNRPKRKNTKHIHGTNKSAEEMARQIAAGQLPTDEEIKRAIQLLTE